MKLTAELGSPGAPVGSHVRICVGRDGVLRHRGMLSSSSFSVGVSLRLRDSFFLSLYASGLSLRSSLRLRSSLSLRLRSLCGSLSFSCSLSFCDSIGFSLCSSTGFSVSLCLFSGRNLHSSLCLGLSSSFGFSCYFPLRFSFHNSFRFSGGPRISLCLRLGLNRSPSNGIRGRSGGGSGGCGGLRLSLCGSPRLGLSRGRCPGVGLGSGSARVGLHQCAHLCGRERLADAAHLGLCRGGARLGLGLRGGLRTRGRPRRRLRRGLGLNLGDRARQHVGLGNCLCK